MHMLNVLKGGNKIKTTKKRQRRFVDVCWITVTFLEATSLLLFLACCYCLQKEWEAFKSEATIEMINQPLDSFFQSLF